MKKIKLTAALFAWLSLGTVGAQTAEDYQTFFLQSLNHQTADFQSPKKLKLKVLEEKRSEIWTAWKAANASFREEKLIALAPISETTDGKWNLPENLEPKAVMPYYYGSKGERPEEGYPFFLYLHGSGPKEAEWATGLKLAQLFDDAPSVYFVPQIPNEGAYYRWYQKSKQYAWSRLFRQVMLQDYINPNRLYLFGISEGGYGSQRLASFYADYLAAAGPMAGGEPLKNAPAENCGHIGFSLLTGAQDKGFYRDILTGYVNQSFDSLQHIHPEAYQHRVELVPNRAHAIDYRPTTPWLKKFSRNPWPRHFIWEDFEMDGIHRSGFYNLVVNERPDKELRTRYDMAIEDNVVNLKVRNVHYETIQKDPYWGIEMKFNRTYTAVTRGAVTIYLDEHLVDLKKSVTVIVNGKKVFDGKLKCNTQNMVRSLSVFGDPMRIYPAAVEVRL